MSCRDRSSANKALQNKKKKMSKAGTKLGWKVGKTMHYRPQKSDDRINTLDLRKGITVKPNTSFCRPATVTTGFVVSTVHDIAAVVDNKADRPEAEVADRSLRAAVL